MRIRRYSGRFYGFRVNCEQVPQLPARLVRAVWDDPRGIPYLLLWRGRPDGEVKEAVRVTRCSGGAVPGYDFVEVKRREGGAVRVRVLWRALPRGGGRVLLLKCALCGKPCRALYCWGVGESGGYYSATRTAWNCRKCNRLRYTSEGGALLLRYAPVYRNLGLSGPVPCERPEPWYPLIYSNPAEAAGVRISG